MSDNLSTAEGTSADGIFDDLADIFSHEVSKSIPPEKCFSFPLSFSFFFCWQIFGSDLTLLNDIKMQQTSLFFFSIYRSSRTGEMFLLPPCMLMEHALL